MMMLLQQKSQQSADLERKEWERVSEHAQFVLDENVSLLKQQELLKEQIKEMKAQHQAIGETKLVIYFIVSTLLSNFGTYLLDSFSAEQ